MMKERRSTVLALNTYEHQMDGLEGSRTSL